MNSNCKTIILTIGFFLALHSLAFARAGDLDATFGTGGKVITDFPGGAGPKKMAIQPDGKIVVQTSNFLARYNPNGTLDTGFGNGGIIKTPYQAPSFEYFTNGLAILPDGKILVSGVANNPTSGNSPAFAVFRFNGDGSRDAMFGTNGVAIWSFDLAGDRDDYAIKLRVQPDGKIVVAGYLSNYCSQDPLCYYQGFAVIRFNTNGSLDSSFGTNGAFIIPPSESIFVDDFVILPNGRILMIGSVFVSSNNTVVFLRRFNANGTPDTSFGTNGEVRPGINETVDIYQLAIQADGKIVFPVYNNRVSPTFTTIVRLNADGTFDTSFGSNGKVVIQNTEGFFYSSILIQPNGKILAGDSALTSGTIPYRFAILRLNPDGNRDTTFGSNGIVTTLMASYGGWLNDLALQPDGKLVACGQVQDHDSDANIGLARYLLDSTRPTRFDFDGDGRADISVFRPSDGIWYLNQSTNGFSAAQFGLSSDIITPADFDGDGKTDISVYRDGTWFWLGSSNGNFKSIQFGLASDIPVPADFNGDGKAGLAVWRPSTGIWYVYDLSTNQYTDFQFGASEDKPLIGDFDGDSKSDYAVYRSSSGIWYIQRSSLGFTAAQFGTMEDKPAAADYDGDGKTDIAVYRPSTGIWYLNRSSAGFTAFQFGMDTDLPAPADYDGDRQADIAVFRPSNGVWYLQRSTFGFTAMQFGALEDKPVPNAFVR